MRSPFRSRRSTDCGCTPSFEDDTLSIDADECAGDGILGDTRGCRASAVEALTARDADVIVSRSDGLERIYDDGAAALFVAAGRFVQRSQSRDERLAVRARNDPLAAAREATGRTGPIAEIAAETGLATAAAAIETYDDLSVRIGPTVARSRIDRRPPPDGTLTDVRELDTGAAVRVYRRRNAELRTYHVEPAEYAFDPADRRRLDDAYELLARGAVGDGERAPARAVRRAADGDDDVPIAEIEAALRKHATGYGIVEDLFADPGVSDAFVTAPIGRTPIRVVADGETMRTNVRLTESGGEALASRLRRESGRAFSRADPTLNATADVDDGVRVAAVSEPATDGLAFAFRAQDDQAWTLPALVANGTVSSEIAGLLSVAVERGAAVLLAGARGAGKTTMLGALCWELPAATRVVAIEDTPELPIDSLQSAGRDVQPLRVSPDGDGGELRPAEALRTALRLGDGALVVGEVRGEEAQVLYEAMRVGASDGAVLGTIHGDGGESVRERVISDLGVPSSSFAATDLVVTLRRVGDPSGSRRIAAVEELVGDRAEPRFERLHTLDDGACSTTGRIDRGNSALVAELADSSETYADVRRAIDRRGAFHAELAADGSVSPSDVVAAHADRRADGHRR